MRLRLSAALLLITLGAPSVAQPSFCIGGELDHLSSTEKAACQAKAAHLRDAVRVHGAPADWHFIVVCDDAGWNDYAAFTGREAARLVRAAYSTERDMHLTFVRGGRLDADKDEAAEQLLSAALKGVPGVVTAPRALPNPERVVRRPAPQVAEAQQPENDDVAGQ